MFATFSLNINVNMNMYSVAVNLYKIRLFFSLLAQGKSCIVAKEQNISSVFMYGVWVIVECTRDTVEVVVMRLKASPREGPYRKWLLPWGWFYEARDILAAVKRQSIKRARVVQERYRVDTSEGAGWKHRVSLGRDCAGQGDTLYLKLD